MSSSTSSSWATKFEKKLTALADGASKESIQTLATWIVFNRKHGQAFANVLLQHLTATSTTTSRQALYWQLIHQVFVSNKEDHDKWDRTLDLRIIVGESVVLVALPDLIATAAAASTTTTSSTTADLVEGMIKEWDQHNVFGGPTLIGQIKRILVTARSKTTTSGTTTTASSSETVVAVTAANSTTNSTAVEAGNPPDKEGLVATTTATSTTTSTATANSTIPSPIIIETSRSSPATRRASLSSVGSSSTHGKQRRGSLSSVQSEQVPIDYDFDSTNIPSGVVEPKEFLDPCKAVATLQIARDVRHDTPVQLHGLLANLPKDIQDYVSALSQNTTTDTSTPSDDRTTVTPVEDLDAATIRDYSLRIPTQLLEMDWMEQIQTIQTFQDIIRRQKQARQKLIYLLIKSRCQFGSYEAAHLFNELQNTQTALQKKKQLLVDALELEGMDAVVLEDKAQDKLLEETLSDLSPLSWYNPNDDGDVDVAGSSGSIAKRQKVE